MPVPEQLHFLRPEAFYAFIPLLLFLLLYLTGKVTSLSWKSVCDDRLLPHILMAGGKKSGPLPLVLITLAASISIVALAGPVWKKLPQPVFREESALVIALDLSQSMLAGDVKPSRLERAKLKVLDLISARKGGQTALIVYAATAFTVTPLTDDDNTIANLIPALEPALMPAQGSSMTAALALAGELLQQAGVGRGDVLVITDGIEKTANEAIETLAASGHRLSIMGVGTTDGGPIPLSGGFLTDASGAIVITRLEPLQLQRAALQGGGLYTTMGADDRDIEKLAGLFASKRVKAETSDTELRADIWREEGPWLLLLVIPLVALWPRRGWLLCLALYVLPAPQPAYAFDAGALWPRETGNLWLRPDQQGMKAFEAGDAETAAELFDDSAWKAAAYYRAGQYEKASELLDAAESGTGYYNRGNALAKLGQYQEAINAYDQAISLDPGNEDARFNRELVRKALEQQQQQQQQQQGDQQQEQSQDQSEQQQQQTDQQPSDAQAQQQQHDAQSEEAQRGDPSEDRQQGAQDRQDQLTDINERKDDASEEDRDRQQQKPEAQEEQDTEAELEAHRQDEAFEQEDAETVENEQAMEQWLRRIPDDPGGLLRRKFIYQYRQMPNQAEAREPW